MRVSKQIISIAPPALAGRISKNPCSNTSTLYNTIHITLKIIIYYNYTRNYSNLIRTHKATVTDSDPHSCLKSLSLKFQAFEEFQLYLTRVAR